MTKKVYIETFGCQMNKLDSELMAGQLLADGWQATERAAEADLVLLVTCAVRERAEQKVYAHLGAFKRLKRERPGMVLAVAGCVAQKEGERLLERAPHVDIVCGTQQIGAISELVELARAGRRGLVCVEDGDPFEQSARTSGARPLPFQAYVAVMRGCDNYCAYCIVPYVRGPVVSRPVETILAEVETLAAEGVVDLTLLGQNIDAYGSDVNGASLAGLLERVAKVPGIRRLKFITNHPRFMTEEILRAMGAEEKVAPYLHMPAQSGSDRILEAMGRGYTCGYYLDLCERARAIVPDLEISGDFIVGFPGETDQDAQETLELVEKVGYKNIFAFKYSPRPPARSAKVADDVPPEVKQERLMRLLELARGISQRRLARHVGSVREALVEGPSKTDPAKSVGRTADDVVVIIENGRGLEGRFVRVRITRSSPVALYGEIEGEKG